MNGKRSNYDQLFITGRRCFYVDPRKDHRIDHFYSWKSFFSGFPGSVYVWCRDQLLYSYQKFIIFLLAALLFTFPVYAEDEKYEFQSIQNEALYLQGYDLNQYYNSVNHQRLLAENPNDTAINVYSDSHVFDLLDISARKNNANQLYAKFNFVGEKPAFTSILISTTNVDPFWLDYRDTNIYDNYFVRPSAYTGAYDPYIISGVKVKFDDETEKSILFDDVSLSPSNLTNSYTTIIEFIGGKMTAYLEQVATVFTWILTHITELITFILGNPFLAVSLVLFMCGAVISFYVRIKNS